MRAASISPGLQHLQDGIWVLGLIRGSAAETAGMRQGDELLEVDGQPVAGRSPFQVAALISGPDADESAVRPYVELKVGLCGFFVLL